MEARTTFRDNTAAILIGNKTDKPNAHREVSTDEGARLAKKLRTKFIETSAKTGPRVVEAFEILAIDMHRQHPAPTHVAHTA